MKFLLSLLLSIPSFALTLSEPLVLTASQDKDIVISGLHFKDVLEDGVAAISIQGSSRQDTINVTITDCYFENVRWAIKAWGVINIHVHGNRFDRVGTGFLASQSQGVRVEYNEFTNVGYHKVKDHGFGNYWAQQAVYFIEVHGDSNSISHNIFDYGDQDNPYLEDILGMWNSGGTLANPLIVQGNQIRGGHTGSSTGAGILVGDAKGADPIYAQHIEIKDNTLVNAQSIAIGVAGGSNYLIKNNRAYYDLEHSEGLTQHPHNPEHNTTPGGGIMIYDYSEIGCQDITVEDNEMFTTRADNVANPWWFDETTCSGLSASNNIWHWDLNYSGSLSESILPENLFSGLSAEYYSGRNEIPQSLHLVNSSQWIQMNEGIITVDSPEVISLRLYNAQGSLIKHWNTNNWRAPVHEITPQVGNYYLHAQSSIHSQVIRLSPRLD